jgi:hypothetical protein
MELGFILFLVWTAIIWKLAYSQGRLTGGREGAQALARHAAHFNITSHYVLESDADALDVRKTLSRLDRGGKAFSDYG